MTDMDTRRRTIFSPVNGIRSFFRHVPRLASATMNIKVAVRPQAVKEQEGETI